MEYVIGTIWTSLELCCVVLFCGTFLPKRELHKRAIAASILLWAIVCIYPNIPMNHFVKQALTVSCYMALSLVLYRGTWFAHLCLAVIFYIFIAAIDAITVNGMCTLLGIDYNTFVWRKLSYITLTTAEKLLAVFLAWALYHFRPKSNLGKQRSRWMQLSILFPAVSAVMLAVLFYTSADGDDIAAGVAVFAGILMIANAAILYVINQIERAVEQEQELRLLRQQISMQAESYTALKESYSVQRKSTHEFERHIRVLKDLLDQKEYEAAREYVRQLQADRALKVFSILSNNPVIDVVLNQKHQAAQENNIKMHVKVNDLSAVSINTNQLVVLLSNLLDNAIEACQKLEKSREIVCSILMEDSLYVAIRNTSSPVEIIHGEIATTKPDKAEHGYGLSAVKYILEQLGAEYAFTYSGGWFQFVAEIRL